MKIPAFPGGNTEAWKGNPCPSSGGDRIRSALMSLSSTWERAHVHRLPSPPSHHSPRARASKSETWWSLPSQAALVAPGVVGIMVALSTSADSPSNLPCPVPQQRLCLLPSLTSCPCWDVKHQAFPEAARATLCQMLEIQRPQAVLGS